MLCMSMITFMHLTAMKRTNEQYPRNKRRRISSRLPTLPYEMQFLVIKACVGKQKKLVQAITLLQAFVSTCRTHYTNHYDNVPRIHEWIFHLSEHYTSPNESILNYLRPTSMKELSVLYEKLRALLSEDDSKQENIQKIEDAVQELKDGGGNINFTYNYSHQPNTLLMVAYRHNKPNFFSTLLGMGADPCQLNSHGKNLLMMATQYPLTPTKLAIFMPKIVHTINQQNLHNKETALLKCIKNRAKYKFNSAFYGTLELLLDSGADPELSNKYGETPLMAIEALSGHLYKNDIITMIRDKIKQKNQNPLV
jgi:hypothetical protein